METLVMICEKIWVVLIIGSFFVCWAKGWLKKGFYLTSDQKLEAEIQEMQKEEEKKNQKKRFVEYATMNCRTDGIDETQKIEKQ